MILKALTFVVAYSVIMLIAVGVAMLIVGFGRQDTDQSTEQGDDDS